MSQKLMPRLGSAIASTILSLFSGVLLVGVDKAQAATLTYTFDLGAGYYSPPNRGISYLKVDNSSVTGIADEYIAVSEGRLYGPSLAGGKEYYDLAGKSALFSQGNFRGLQTSGWDNTSEEISFEVPLPPGGPSESYTYTFILDRSIFWTIQTPWSSFTLPISQFIGYYEQYSSDRDRPRPERTDRQFYNFLFSYTLVNTEAEPVPEPLTAGGTALALAGLSWLKQKKKKAA
jgi:hypothetical protein